MRRLHLKLYVAIVGVLVLFTVMTAMIWHASNSHMRFLLHGAHIVLVLGVLGGAIALLAYPIARRLTARLARLNEGVRRFGSGDLATRVPVEGRDEVSMLAASFNDAATRIEQLVRANQMLLANCSHELRTPLTRMRLAIEQLGGNEGARAELTRNIGELDALIGELLLTSRLDAAQGPERIEAVDLLALAAEEAAHYDREVSGDAVTLDADPRLLRRLVRNLLENARMHAGGATDVRITRSGVEVRIVVEDAGPGIPPEDRERVFEPFYRRRDQGTGLGLAIVRQIARVHGGEVSLEAREGGGSRFVVRLPAAPRIM